jgi:hypothetical protein
LTQFISPLEATPPQLSATMIAMPPNQLCITHANQNETQDRP